MIYREKIKDSSETIDLVRTYSDEGFRLLQKETDILYGSSVVDIIDGYDEGELPFSRYTYEETNIKNDVEEDL